MTTPAPPIAFRAPDSRSAALHARARRVLPGGNTRTTVYQSPHPPYAARGRGAYLEDVEGTRYLDLVGNYTALIHGHADPDIAAAVAAQLQEGTAYAMPTEHEVALAELLAARIPSVEQVRFANSGTEAVMLAVKAARAHTGRPKLAKFAGCYHGGYDYAEVGQAFTPEELALADPPTTPYSSGTPQGVLDDVIVLPYNDEAALARAIAREGEQLAAVIIDPLPSRIGTIAATPAFLQRVRELTDAHGIVLIFDEVISLRVGHGGMQGTLGVAPDLTTMGKIIGGGFPVGAVGGQAAIMAVFDPSRGQPKAPHGGTFNANPITMVAGLAALAKLDEAAFARLDRLGARLRDGLAEALDGARLPGQITGAGSLFQVHLHDRPLSDFRSGVPTTQEARLRAALYEGLLARGVLTTPTLFGCLSTPMGEAEVDTAVAAFAGALAGVVGERG